MTDEQIEKALERCSTEEDRCQGCPYNDGDPDIFSCAIRLPQDALALIKRQKEDIEWARERILNADKRIAAQREELRRLNKAISDTRQSRDGWAKEVERIGKQLYEVFEAKKQARAEAIRDFVQRLRCESYFDGEGRSVTLSNIHTIARGMMEEQK